MRPENTLAAFEHGAACGVDGFEFDVRLARDGELVVIHDEVLDRTTDASGPVSALTSDELARVDAAAKFKVEDGAPFKGQGIGIPRFRDVLRRFPGLPCVVELKGDDPEVARAAVRIARDEGAIERLCFGGFTDAVVQAARDGGAPVTSAATEEIRWALYRSWVGLTPKAPRYMGFQVPERYGPTPVATRSFIKVMTRAGLFVHIWTVNAPPDLTRLLDWGVNGVITDVPDVAVGVVREWMAVRGR